MSAWSDDTRRRAAVAILVLGVASGANAQDGAASMQQSIIQSTTNANIIRGMYDGGAHVGTSGTYVGRPGSRGDRDRLAPGRSAVPARRTAALFARPVPAGVVGAALPYRSTPALRREAIASLAARLSPTTGRTLQARVANYDVPRIYAGLVQPYGLRTDDAADAVTAYNLLGWLIATEAPDPDPGAVQAVRTQVALRLAANPRFADPHMRGAFAEEMKLLFVMLHGGWQLARRDGNLSAYADGVARTFAQQTGSDPRALRLTRQGFVHARTQTSRSLAGRTNVGVGLGNIENGEGGNLMQRAQYRLPGLRN